MPTIKLTDQFGLDEDITLADRSALRQYFQQLPSLRADHLDLAKAGGLTLDQPALTSLSSGVSFDKPVPLGSGSTDLSINAGAHASFAVWKRSPGTTSLPDVLADDIDLPEDACYVSFGIDAAVGANIGTGAGMLTFGVAPSATITIVNYRTFPLHQGVTLLDALRESVGSFLIPASIEDLSALPPGSLATVTGAGSLKLGVTANLLAVSNPLASVSLPGPLPALSVCAGGTATVNTSYEIACTYQICAHKLPSGKILLGWYHDRSSEIQVGATLSEGVSASLGSTDLFSTIVSKISANPAADLNELAQAKLSDDEIAGIRDAVTAAVQRKLELALSAQLSSTRCGDASFSYEIDLAALTPESRSGLEQALRGDLTSLHASTLPGISCVSSAWGTAVTRGISFHVNLLGILNVGSIATLTKSGRVMCEPATGALVITDQVSASRIQSTQVNFGADTQKLRQVMSESFLITAVYTGTQRKTSGPALRFRHSYFDLGNQTALPQIMHMLRMGLALQLFSLEESVAPPGVQDFGRTMIHATTEYDDGLAASVFLDPHGTPLTHEFYEQMGRNAVQYLVNDSDFDAVRRRPAIDDSLWAQMKATGQPGFGLLFPSAPPSLLGAITADYSTIMWWADAMTGAAQRLATIRQWFDANPAASNDDLTFQSLRGGLSDHLKKVVANTREEFGMPWGLLAMNEAAAHKPGATLLIAGPRLARSKERLLAAVSKP